jgi:hypothetical protein
MKQLKGFLWLLVLGLVGLIIYQNQNLFLDKQSFRLDFYVIDAYRAPDLPNAVFLLACLLLGLLFSYFFSLAERFKAKRTIRELSTMIDAHLKEIAALRNEVASLKGGPGPGHAPEGTGERT